MLQPVLHTFESKAAPVHDPIPLNIIPVNDIKLAPPPAYFQHTFTCHPLHAQFSTLVKAGATFPTQLSQPSCLSFFLVSWAVAKTHLDTSGISMRPMSRKSSAPSRESPCFSTS